MKKQIYNSIYRLFEEGDYGLTINVGSLTMKLYDADREEMPTVWERGVVVNDQVYQVGDLYNEGKGPGNYAELFTGEYDIIAGLADVIYEDFQDFFEKEDPDTNLFMEGIKTLLCYINHYERISGKELELDINDLYEALKADSSLSLRDYFEKLIKED